MGQNPSNVLEKSAELCRKRGVIIPTFAEQKDPTLVPEPIKQKLKGIGLWDVHPLNLFRITWKNEPVEKGGLFRDVTNWVEFPPELTGVPARIVGIVGKYFPTGAHKVGAGFGCLVPRLVSGEFDPTTQKAVWPSTGNFCRGGAFDCALLACTAVAILPERMSRERFEWLRSVHAEVIATPGCESNVKEIYDKCWEIRKTRPDCVIFNQFEEFGNSNWHYHVTGSAIEGLFQRIRGPKDRLAAFVSATGSAGTIAAGDYLKKRFPGSVVVAVEAVQCPTLLRAGFGDHRIEGIGDKHVPWIHNVRNTDLVAGIDDAACVDLMRLFNEPAGHEFLADSGVAADTVGCLPLLGFSGICNVLAAIKTAKYYELGSNDMLFAPLTDSMDLYRSRIEEERAAHGEYRVPDAARHFARHLEAVGKDDMRELGYWDRKALHNLKYFTWVEQQQKDVRDLDRLWNPDFWDEVYAQVDVWDRKIREFNRMTGLLEKLS